MLAVHRARDRPGRRALSGDGDHGPGRGGIAAAAQGDRADPALGGSEPSHPGRSGRLGADSRCFARRGPGAPAAVSALAVLGGCDWTLAPGVGAEMLHGHVRGMLAPLPSPWLWLWAVAIMIVVVAVGRSSGRNTAVQAI